MNSIYKIIAIFTFVCLFRVQTYAQEYILPLGNNPVLQENKHSLSVKKSTEEIVLELPFVDDFSYQGPYPDSSLWADRLAFVNTSYAVSPPSIGVATLDAVDETGSIYATAKLAPITFFADSLSSHSINLEYSPSDNVYLSFFYQPQGNGLEPATYDSLLVDFFKVDSGTWHNVWKTAGDTLQDFKQVLIPVTEEAYLKNGFKFRFRNLASMPQNSDYFDKRGNVDHWNIDYVRLDKNRSSVDTVIRDVAIVSPVSSMLSDYEAIPWTHFEKAYNTNYRPYITVEYQNNDTATRNVERDMKIYDLLWNEEYGPKNPTAQDIGPGDVTSYNITSIYPFDFSRGNNAEYLIKTWIRTDDFDNKANDTLYRTQQFKDYFAYDDGSAERAYGLRGQGTNNALIAVEFESYIPDRLTGVDIYFTQLMDSINEGYYYKFMVWNDIEGVPGELIYEGSTDYTVAYSDSLNSYKRYHFDEEVEINGTFYVGLMQYNQYLLNIGLDVNNPANGRLMYNLGKEWSVSSAPGSLMLRPIVKSGASKVTDKKVFTSDFIIYPNPASESIFLKMDDQQNTGEEKFIRICDLSGKIVKSSTVSNQEIAIHDLPSGIYFVHLSTENLLLGTQKLIIRH